MDVPADPCSGAASHSFGLATDGIVESIQSSSDVDLSIYLETLPEVFPSPRADINVVDYYVFRHGVHKRYMARIRYTNRTHRFVALTPGIEWDALDGSRMPDDVPPDLVEAINECMLDKMTATRRFTYRDKLSYESEDQGQQIYWVGAHLALRETLSHVARQLKKRNSSVPSRLALLSPPLGDGDREVVEFLRDKLGLVIDPEVLVAIFSKPKIAVELDL